METIIYRKYDHARCGTEELSYLIYEYRKLV
jgi:hypothetical protein